MFPYNVYMFIFYIYILDTVLNHLNEVLTFFVRIDLAKVTVDEVFSSAGVEKTPAECGRSET